MQALYLVLGILMFVLVENYIVLQAFKRGQVAVQDLPVTCEQTADGKYYVAEDGFANVYNGTGRNIQNLVVTVRYVTASNPAACSYERQAGDFEPYMKDGKFNAYQLSFKVEQKADALTDSEILWLEFDVESYDIATGLSDYLMIGAFVVGCVGIFMFWYSKKTYKSLSEGEASSVAVIGEAPVQEKDEEVPEAVAVEEKEEAVVDAVEEANFLM